MSTLVTGGSGFIGSHLTERLLQHGEQVTIIDDMSTGDISNLDSVRSDSNLDIVKQDLTDGDRLRDVISEHQKVYHLAAKIGGVGYLRDQPADIIAENDDINKTVFEACVAADIDRIVFASSSMVYSESETFPLRETQISEIPPPRGAYGFQKLNGEYYCKAYREQYGLEYAIARIFNVVGPRDWPEGSIGHGHVVPDLVHKIVYHEQDPVRIKGSGEQTRAFTDVRDTVNGLIKCMEDPQAKYEAINLGSTHETSIVELVNLIWELTEKEGTPEIARGESFKKDVERRVPSNEKAQQILGWEPQYSLSESLETYIRAYREWLK